MKIKNVIAVSGASGLYELVSSKNSGLVLKDPISGKSKFYSVRLHQFTPLETVGIYTMTDTVDLKKIFGDMLERKAELPLPSVKADNKVLSDYFAQVLPEYDRDRVYPSDIKKVLKWYQFLDDLGYLTLTDEEEEEVKDDESE